MTSQQKHVADRITIMEHPSGDNNNEEPGLKKDNESKQSSLNEKTIQDRPILHRVGRLPKKLPSTDEEEFEGVTEVKQYFDCQIEFTSEIVERNRIKNAHKLQRNTNANGDPQSDTDGLKLTGGHRSDFIWHVNKGVHLKDISILEKHVRRLNFCDSNRAVGWHIDGTSILGEQCPVERRELQPLLEELVCKNYFTARR